MAINEIMTLFGIQFPTSVFISELTDASPNSGITELVTFPAGHVAPLFAGVSAIRPEISFTSPQIKRTLDAIGQYGLAISSQNLDLLYRTATNLGTRAALSAGASHYRFRATRALFVWESITASQEGVATITGRAMLLSPDGSATPLTPAGSITLSGTQESDEQFTLGPVEVNSSLIQGIQSVTVNSGLSYIVAGGSGELYPTFAGINQGAPSVDITTLAMTAPWSFGLPGTALSEWNVWFRKRNATGLVADGTSEHILFSGTRGKVIPLSTSGGAVGESTTTMRLTLIADAPDTPPMTIDTTAAIS